MGFNRALTRPQLPIVCIRIKAYPFYREVNINALFFGHLICYNNNWDEPSSLMEIQLT